MLSLALFCVLLLAGSAVGAVPQQCLNTANLMISQLIEGTGYTKGIQLYNPTNSALDMKYYEIWIQTKCPATGCAGATEAENSKYFAAGNQVKIRRLDQVVKELPARAVLTISHPNADNEVLRTQSNVLYYEWNLQNGNDPIALVCGAQLPDGSGIDPDQAHILDRVGAEGPNQQYGFDVCGIKDATKDHTLVRKSQYLKPNADWAQSAGDNEEDCEWLVYEADTVSKWTFHNVQCPTDKLFISQYIEMDSFEKGIEVYNPVGRNVDLRFYDLWIGQQGTGGWRARVALSGVLDVRQTLSVGNANADSEGPLASADLQAHQINFFNGNEAVALVACGQIIDLVGDPSETPAAGWSVAGIADATKNRVLLRKTWILRGNTNWAQSAGTSYDDSEWIVSDYIEAAARKRYQGHVQFPAAMAHALPVPDAVQRQVAAGVTPAVWRGLANRHNGPGKRQGTNPNPTVSGVDPLSTWDQHTARCYQNTTGEQVFEKTDTFFSHYLEGDGNDKGYAMFNPTECVSPRSACTPSGAIDLDYYAVVLLTRPTSKWLTGSRLSLSGQLSPGALVVVGHPNAPAELLAEVSLTSPVLNFGNGNEALGLLCAGHLIDAVGEEGNTVAAGWDVAGVPDATANHMLFRKPTVKRGNYGDWPKSAGTNADDSEWIVAPSLTNFTCWDRRDCSSGEEAPVATFPPPATTAVATLSAGGVAPDSSQGGYVPPDDDEPAASSSAGGGVPDTAGNTGNGGGARSTTIDPNLLNQGSDNVLPGNDDAGNIGPFSPGVFAALVVAVLVCLLISLLLLLFLVRRRSHHSATVHHSRRGRRGTGTGSRREMTSRRRGTGSSAHRRRTGGGSFATHAGVTGGQEPIYMAPSVSGETADTAYAAFPATAGGAVPESSQMIRQGGAPTAGGEYKAPSFGSSEYTTIDQSIGNNEYQAP